MDVVPYQIRRILPLAVRILSLFALTLCVLAAALMGYSVFRREQAVSLPAPTGPFTVGRTIYDLVDTGRRDPLDELANTPRKLQVWVWYPADATTSASPAPYVPAAWTSAIDADLGIGRFLRQDLLTVHSHARANPPLTRQVSRFPVVIFEPGYGDIPANYTTLLENLASHGYVVVGIVPTDMAPVVAFSDGRILKRSAAGELPDEAPPSIMDPMVSRLVRVSSTDVRFVLDQLQTEDARSSGQFASRLDLGHVAIVGHSLGGATAIEVCRTEPHCGAAVDIDGTPVGESILSGISRPLLVLQYAFPGNTEEDQKLNMVVGHSTGPRFHVVIQGAGHLNCSDYAMMFDPVLRLAGALGSIDGRHGLDVSSTYVAAFLDQYLKGSSTPLLGGPSPRYPEVTFVTP